MVTKYTIEQLEEEKGELDFTKASLLNMDELSEQTAKVLKVIDLRLKNMGKIISPIYNSTEKLFLMYDNVSYTLNTLDNVLKYYDIPTQESAVITAGIEKTKVVNYLESVKHLNEADAGLAKLNFRSAAQSQKDIEKLLIIAQKSVKSLLDQKLKIASKDMDPSNMDTDFDIENIISDGYKEIRYLIKSYRDTGVSEDYIKELCDIFATSRGVIVCKFLENLAISCFKMLQVRKSSTQSLKTGSSQNLNPTTNFIILVPDKSNQGANASIEFKNYSSTMIKYLMFEKKLIEMIIPSNHSYDTFITLADVVYAEFAKNAKDSCDIIVSNIYANLVNAIEFQSICKESFVKLNDLIDLSNRKKFEISNLVGAITPPLNTSFANLIQTLQSLTNKPPLNLHAGIYDPVKWAFGLLEDLIEHRTKIYSVLVKLGDKHWSESIQGQNTAGITSEKKDGEYIFKSYTEDYITSIGSVVEIVSKKITKPALMFVFQASHYNYMANTIKNSSQISSIVDNSLITKYQTLTQRNRKASQATWQSSIATFMSSNLSPNEKLDLFNTSFETNCKDLSDFLVPDAELRAGFVQDAIDSLVPKYSEFLKENNINERFVKNSVPTIIKKIDQTYIKA
ncbi:hypothetical protein BB561_001086 [Smittium simulii]|uniref:Exocyst complex protein EXO70 n=1 Tax=Smittium simulii TaxID=133385 RepID=A0A2T9YW69_9FUNG|nr:hypothetical protein BB561_001086 [Smittium simulii]